jgi:hypothetical protein
LKSIGACAINSWFHRLLPVSSLGYFFEKRLLIAAALACGATMLVDTRIDFALLGATRRAYAIAFAGAGMAGLATAREPVTPAIVAPVQLRAMLAAPLEDANFRRVLLMLGGWNMASNLAAPFLKA